MPLSGGIYSYGRNEAFKIENLNVGYDTAVDLKITIGPTTSSSSNEIYSLSRTLNPNITTMSRTTDTDTNELSMILVPALEFSEPIPKTV